MIHSFGCVKRAGEAGSLLQQAKDATLREGNPAEQSIRGFESFGELAPLKDLYKSVEKEKSFL